MINQDTGFRLKELTNRINEMEKQMREMMKKTSEAEDWDNAKLMQEWKISRRTAANYRKQGLNFFKRGGRIYYSPQDRIQFTKNKVFDLKRKELVNGK